MLQAPVLRLGDVRRRTLRTGRLHRNPLLPLLLLRSGLRLNMVPPRRQFFASDSPHRGHLSLRMRRQQTTGRLPLKLHTKIHLTDTVCVGCCRVAGPVMLSDTL